MLKKAPWLQLTSDFSIAVNEALPADWPSAAVPGDACFHVFQSREFLTTWLASRGQCAKTSCYFVEINNRLGERVMLLPLAITRVGGVRVLGFVDGGLADYGAPVIYPHRTCWSKELVAALWDAVVERLPRVDLVKLKNMPPQIGVHSNPLSLMETQLNEEGAHGADLTASWETIESRQGHLKTLKRNIQRLERLGEVKLVVAQTADEVERLLDVALAQKQRRHEETKVRSVGEDQALLTYFRAASRSFSAIGQLHLAALEVNGEIVGTSWSLIQGTHVYCIMIGFADGEWRRYSCGRILNFMLLRHLKERGYAYFDQCIGDESWKFQACETHVALQQCVAPVNWRGTLLLRYWAGRAALRQNPHWQKIRRALHRPAQVSVAVAE